MSDEEKLKAQEGNLADGINRVSLDEVEEEQVGK